MTDEFKAYIKSLIVLCKEETGHAEYETHVTWHTKQADLDKFCVGNGVVKLSILIDPVYLWCDVDVYPDVFVHYKRKEYGQIGAFVLHEICHLFVEPVAVLLTPKRQNKIALEAVERQTQRITNAIFNQLPENWYTPTFLKKNKYL